MKIFTKKAFTLAELLIVLCIVGILIAIAVAVMRPQEMGRKAYISSALNSLDKALYNSHAYFDESNTAFKHPFDEELKKEESAKNLCVVLTNYLNVTENNCDSAQAIEDFGDDTVFSKDNRSKYLQFVTSNGLHVFLSPRQGEAATAEDDNHFFYIIYVDINGDKSPNTSIYSENTTLKTKKYPDVYAFAAITLGRVIPLGVLEVDDKLLTAKMAWMNGNGKVITEGYYLDSNNKEQYYTDRPTSYAKAKSRAWNFYRSGSKTDIINDDSYSEMQEEPYAYNDYINNMLGEDTTFLKNLTLSMWTTEPDNFVCATVQPGLTTQDPPYDGSCTIQIDTYTY